jgi:hypothetical protein
VDPATAMRDLRVLQDATVEPAMIEGLDGRKRPACLQRLKSGRCGAIGPFQDAQLVSALAARFVLRSTLRVQPGAFLAGNSKGLSRAIVLAPCSAETRTSRPAASG